MVKMLAHFEKMLTHFEKMLAHFEKMLAHSLFIEYTYVSKTGRIYFFSLF